jgi:hypothetical protein
MNANDTTAKVPFKGIHVHAEASVLGAKEEEKKNEIKYFRVLDKG